ncbi:MAG: ATP-binding protein [Eubacterium sp.]
MKLKKVSIKWKIYLWLLGFVAIIIGLFWVFQTIYLETFYKTVKIGEMNSLMNELTRNLDSLGSSIKELSDKYGICIAVADENGEYVYSSEQDLSCAVHKWDTLTVRKYQKLTESNDGTFKQYINVDSMIDETREIPDPEDKNEHNNPENINDTNKKGRMYKQQDFFTGRSMLYLKDVTVDGQKLTIILNCVITPVYATVSTLRKQLILISSIVVLLTTIIAMLISRIISKPIIHINSVAKKLAEGDFDVTFREGGYKEIFELSSTLNYTASELAKTEQLQHELIANVSHDLRTPLTMINAYSEIIRDIPGENTPENIQVIIDETNRLTALVNDLLDVSKLQASMTKINKEKYDITESIENVIKRYAKLIEQDNYNISFEYDKHIWVNADEFKMHQVIYNLINNAINYTGEDKRVIIRQEEVDEKVRISVSDTGEGIPQDCIEHIWERYYRTNNTHKSSVTGTGLGLSIVKNVLKLHDAEFGVISEEGKGTTFWFELTIKY